MSNPADQHDPVGPDGFVRLLERLHPDPDQAGVEYERLRARLVKFFDWRGVPEPDECADDTLDRLSHKLLRTAVEDVKKYVFGIARLVALERRRGPAFTSIDDVTHLPLTAAPPADNSTPLEDCFDGCLAKLPDESRHLLLSYYDGERQAKIANRRRLATTLGLSENALRSRIQRLRDLLERCMLTCAPPSTGLTR